MMRENDACRSMAGYRPAVYVGNGRCLFLHRTRHFGERVFESDALPPDGKENPTDLPTAAQLRRFRGDIAHAANL